MPSSVVPIGSVVFALIEPTPGHELAFNRWYERDHFYTAGMAAPGVFSGGRFIATRACKNLRDPADAGVAGDPGRGSHLALWFVLPGHDDARTAFAAEQMARAADDDRLFAEREHLHTWSCVPAWTWRADPHGVPPALALDHRYPAVSVVLMDHRDPDRGLSEEVEVAARPAAEDLDVILAMRPDHEVVSSTWSGEFDPLSRRVLVCFHPTGLDEGWRATQLLLERLTGGGRTKIAWASPFVAAVMGTDLHADDL